MDWNESNIVTLKRLWTSGWSAGLIAKELSTTRNAVIGKISRLGLSGRGSPTRAICVVRQVKPPRTSATDILTANPVSIMNLTSGVCRFPFGEPKAPGFGFCGCACADGDSYCAEHKAIVYVPTPKRNHAKRNIRRVYVDPESAYGWAA